MKNAKKLVCFILSLVCALTAVSCTASDKDHIHKHSYIAVGDESYFVTLNMDGETVDSIDFYNANDYVKTFTLDLEYNLFGRIKNAVTYQYYPDETVKGTDTTVKYDKNGKLAELTVFESEFRVITIEYSENENGDKGYYLRYDGSASFFELNEDNLAKTMLYHVGDEYLILSATYTYDEDGRLVGISAKADPYSTEASFEYEKDSCCFSKMINSAEDGYNFTFERDDAHNATKCEFEGRHRCFSTEFEYDGRQQTVVSTTQDDD